MGKTIQELYEEDYLIFTGACSELGLPISHALPPAGTDNHKATRLYVAEKWPSVNFGAVISRDYYLLGIADLKKAGALKANPSEASNRPKNVGVLFSDSEDAKNNAIPDSVFADPRDVWNKAADEAQALRERRAMQGGGRLETQMHPDVGIVGLKSETEQVIRAGRVSHGETERLQKANREHNNRLRAEHAAGKKGKK